MEKREAASLDFKEALVKESVGFPCCFCYSLALIAVVEAAMGKNAISDNSYCCSWVSNIPEVVVTQAIAHFQTGQTYWDKSQAPLLPHG